MLDCACGIGTQAVGLAALGYDMMASDISDAEITELLLASGCGDVKWLFPEETDFYQPIVIAGK